MDSIFNHNKYTLNNVGRSNYYGNPYIQPKIYYNDAIRDRSSTRLVNEISNPEQIKHTPAFVIISFPEDLFGRKKRFNFENPSRSVDDLKNEIISFLRKLYIEDNEAINRGEIPPHGLKCLPTKVKTISFHKKLGNELIYNVSFDFPIKFRNYDDIGRRSPGRVRFPISLN